MEKKSGNISELQQLVQSEAGQQLLAYLRKTDAEALQEATQKAQTGSYTEAAQALSAMLASPEAQEILKKLGG